MGGAGAFIKKKNSLLICPTGPAFGNQIDDPWEVKGHVCINC